MTASLLNARLLIELEEAEAKAWDSLGRYKFQMFGYWAGVWVHLNRIGEFKRPNPWKEIVRSARGRSVTARISAFVDGENEEGALT
jgi:hypothetical protein